MERDLQRLKAHPKAFIAELLIVIGSSVLLGIGIMMLILSLTAPKSYALIVISQILTYVTMISLGLIGLGIAIFIEWLIDERMKSTSPS